MRQRYMLCDTCQQLLKVAAVHTMGGVVVPCWGCWERKLCFGPLTTEQLNELGEVHVVTRWNRRGARAGAGFDRIIVTVPMPEEELEHLKCRLLPGGKLEFTEGAS